MLGDKQDQVNGRAAGRLPGVQTYNGRRDATGIIGNTVLVNSGLHKPNNF
jgi:hypothetical protein